MQNTEHDIKKYDQYFITKSYKKNSLNEYLVYIEKVLKHGIKLIQFRSKNLSKNQYSIVSAEIYKLCKKYNEKLASKYLKNKNIEINVTINTGKEETTVWTTDLSYEYIKINAEYRT